MVIIKIVRYFIRGIKAVGFSIYYLIRWFLIGLVTTILIFPYYFGLGIYCIFNKEKRKSVGFKEPLIPTIMMILALATYFISVFVFTRWFVQNERIKKMSESILDSTVILEREEDQYSDILDEVQEDDGDNTSNNNENSNGNNYNYNYNYSGFINVDFNSLLSRNPDTVAWIRVNGTKVNYPVVQSSDNKYYLDHDINKYKTDTGWIYGDYRDDFNNFGKNTIIYGHNLINKTMFGSLPWVLKSSWYTNKDNYDIQLVTVNTKSVWRVFSVYKIEPGVDYLKTSFYSNGNYTEWLTLMKSRSIYNFGLDVGIDDKVLTLSTCDDTGNYRVVLHAKLVSIEST